MQIGTENRNKTIAAIALTVLAVVLIAFRFFPSSPGPRSASAAPAPVAAATAPTPRARAVTKKGSSAPVGSLDPTLRYDWLQASENNQYSGTGRNIFLAGAEEIPQPKGPGTTDQHAQDNTPPTPPPPPPINLKFFGFASKPGEPKRVFLSQGEDVFIASEGDIIDRRYKILHIAPMSVEVEDVLNNNRQNIPLTQG